MGLWKLIKPLSSDNTNLITNPSAETATTGYTAKGTNTVAQSTDYQFRGLYSLKCTYQDTANLWGYTAAGLSTSTTYYLKGRVYVPSDWDGGNIYLGSENFTSATTTTVSQYTDGTSPTGAWILLETTLTIAADTAGGYLLVTSSAPTAGKFVYFDCFYISTQDADYFDGDEPGAEWSGTAHASTSVMSAKSRRGGAVVNLDDYSTYVESHAGTGMPQVINRLRSLALQHGAEYLGYDVGPRLVTLVRTTIGTSLANMHSQRKALINALKGDLVSGAQPVRLRYTGAHGANEAEINVVYDAGLEFGGHRGFSERGAVRLLAYDPYWYSLNDEGKTLTTQASDANVNYILSRQAGDWSNMDQGAGNIIESLAVAPDRTLYAAGQFTTVGSGATSANRAASWDGSSWSALGTGLNGTAYVVKVDANGDAYFGGAFTTAGGGGANRIAKWDGSSWSALGTGLDGNVHDILISKDGTIYVCGAFANAGGSGAAYIAKWSGSAWSALGSGLSGGTKALCLAEDSSGNIYVGGDFTTAGGSGANSIAMWDGSAWSTLGTGFSGSIVYDIVYGSDGLLYAVGDFTSAGGVTASRAASWNGAAWSALGSGLNDFGARIEEHNGLFYIGGQFTAAGGLTASDGITLWNGSAFLHLDAVIPSSPAVWAFAFDDYGVDPIIYMGFSGTGATQYGETTTVTNGGTAEAYPVIVFQNTAARGNSARVLFLRNETTGETLYLDYTLTNEDVLYIDLSPGYKRVESSQYGNVIGSAVLAGSDLATFRLAPGTNTITLFVSESGTPSVLAYMKWRPRHWSIDGVAA